MAKNVLITGMSGLIGGLLKNELLKSKDYNLTALNRSYVDGVKNFNEDISDLNAIKAAFVGQDIVVHLAAHLGSQDWESQNTGNILGTYNVFESARESGVKRIVFASSGSTIRGYELISPYKEIAEGNYDQVPIDYPMITHEKIRPGGLYGAAKVWGEALGRHYSDDYGMSVISVRIGVVQKEDKPMSIRENASYLSHKDIVQMLQLCIDAPSTIKNETVYALSNNKWNYRDISHAKNILGYLPKDSADDNLYKK